MGGWLRLLEVRLVGEGASCALDDDVSGVVSSADALVQSLLLNQLGQEACGRIVRPYQWGNLAISVRECSAH